MVVKNLSRLLGNFFFTTPKGDNIIIVVPYIYNDFSLEVPLVSFKDSKCQNHRNSLEFFRVLEFLLKCFSVKLYIITRKKSAELLLDTFRNVNNLKVKVNEDVHAKLFINSRFVILTSANLFHKSIYRNYEFVEIKENVYKDSFKALNVYLPGISL